MTVNTRAIVAAAGAVPDGTLAAVRARLRARPEADALVAALTRVHGRPAQAEAAFARVADAMVRRLLREYGEATADGVARLERHLGELLRDLDARRTGAAQRRALSEQRADLEGLQNSLRDLKTLEQFTREALARPDGPVLTGMRADVRPELATALRDLDVDDAVEAAFREGAVVPQARQTQGGRGRVSVDDDVQRAFAEGRLSSDAPPGRTRERAVPDADSMRARREAAGRSGLTRSADDPRLAVLDLEDLPVRVEDFQRHRRGGARLADAAGRARRDALTRLESVINSTIADLPPLRRHWDEVVSGLMAGRSVDDVGRQGMLDLYARAQGQFWERVAADADATAFLRARGLDFEPGSRAATIRTNGGRPLPVEERRISLDHLREKSQGDNWRSALDPANLALLPQAPNTRREIVQRLLGMR